MFEAKTTPVLRYGLGGLVAATLHCGVVAWSLHASPPEQNEIPDGAFVVEIAIDTAAPDIERREIAIGVQSDAVAPVAAAAPEQAQTAAPNVVPEEVTVPETAPIDPELVLANKKPETVSEEVPPAEPQEITARDAPALAAVSASEATVQQLIESSKPSAAAPRSRTSGLSHQDRREIEDWRRDIVGHINRFKRYPSESRSARDEGTVEVTFIMDRQGRVLQLKISKSSGINRLDRAAVAILALAEPLPAPPAGVKTATIQQTIPINYRWRD